MTQDQARACVAKMRADKGFLDRVQALEDLPARMQFINAEGFDCNAKEMEVESARLSDDDLDAVSGGNLMGFSLGNVINRCFSAGGSGANILRQGRRQDP